jgi:histidine triad (HIT) family protein
MSSIFTKIINREIPSEIVWEDDNFIVFLDINPMQPGHILVVPKVEVDSLYDLDDTTYMALFYLVKKLSKPLQRAMDAKRIGLVVEGFLVPHVHIHLIPLNKPGDLNEKNEREANAKGLHEIAEKLREHFTNL